MEREGSMLKSEVLCEIEAFAKEQQFPFSPTLSVGRCIGVSVALMHRFNKRATVHVLGLIGCKTHFPNMSYCLAPDAIMEGPIDIYHNVAYFPEFDMSVDLTRRQFEPEAEVPFLQSIEDLKKEWLYVHILRRFTNSPTTVNEDILKMGIYEDLKVA